MKKYRVIAFLLLLSTLAQAMDNASPAHEAGGKIYSQIDLCRANSTSAYQYFQTMLSLLVYANSEELLSFTPNFVEAANRFITVARDCAKTAQLELRDIEPIVESDDETIDQRLETAKEMLDKAQNALDTIQNNPMLSSSCLTSDLTNAQARLTNARNKFRPINEHRSNWGFWKNVEESHRPPENSFCIMGKEDLEKLPATLSQGKITEVTLWDCCNLGSEDMQKFCNIMKNDQSVQTLKADDYINDSSASAFADLLRGNNTLKKILFYGTHRFTDKGGKTILEGLKGNASLTELIIVEDQWRTCSSLSAETRKSLTEQLELNKEHSKFQDTPHIFVKKYPVLLETYLCAVEAPNEILELIAKDFLKIIKTQKQ